MKLVEIPNIKEIILERVDNYIWEQVKKHLSPQARNWVFYILHYYIYLHTTNQIEAQIKFKQKEIYEDV